MVNATHEQRARRGEEAFTMVEMLVALVLATIVLSGTLALQVAMIQGERETRDTTVLTRLAKSRLEEFRTAHYDAIVPTASYVWTCYDFQLQVRPSCSTSDATIRYQGAFRITGDAVGGYWADSYVHARRDGGTWVWEPWLRFTLERLQ